MRRLLRLDVFQLDRALRQFLLQSCDPFVCDIGAGHLEFFERLERFQITQTCVGNRG